MALFRGHLRALSFAAFNALALLLLRTQSKPGPFLNFLLFNRVTSEGVLDTLFALDDPPLFTVLTEFKTRPLFPRELQSIYEAVSPTNADAPALPQMIETDSVAEHPCFSVFALVVHFVATRPVEQCAQFVEQLVAVMLNAQTDIKTVVFLLKIVVLFAEYLAPFKQQLVEPLLAYLGRTETGGVGLHYFFRDTLILLTGWFAQTEAPITSVN